MATTTENNKPTKRKLPRVPIPANGIQINCCLNPECENFGKPAALHMKRGRGHKSTDNYIIGTQRRRKKNKEQTKTELREKSIRCKKCRQETRLKSNWAIEEEYVRITDYYFKHLTAPAYPCCPNQDCSNHTTNPTPEWKEGVLSKRKGRQRKPTL